MKIIDKRNKIILHFVPPARKSFDLDLDTACQNMMNLAVKRSRINPANKNIELQLGIGGLDSCLNPPKFIDLRLSKITGQINT